MARKNNNRWRSIKRIQRSVHITMITCGAIAGLLALLVDWPPRWALQGVAILQACASGAWLMRSFIHYREGYFSRRYARLRMLSWLGVALGTAGLFSAAGLYFVVDGPTQAIVALTMSLSFSVVGALTHQAMKATPLQRGSEWVSDRLSALAADETSWVGWIAIALLKNAGPERMSRCYRWIMTVLGLVLALSAPALARPLLRHFPRPTSAVDVIKQFVAGKSSSSGEPGAASSAPNRGSSQPMPASGAKPLPTPPRKHVDKLHSKPAPVPTVEQYCGTAVKAGDGISDPEMAHSIAVAWRKLGGFAASCPGRATQIPGHDGYYVVGSCAGVLRSVGLVTSRGGAHVFLFGTASQVLPYAETGDLIDFQIKPSGEGEIVTLQTDHGTVGLIRALVAQAPKSGGHVPIRACGDVADTEAPYSVLPPSALDAVHRAALEDGWAWPSTAAVDGRPPFTLRTGTGLYYEPKAGTISCTPDDDCVLHRRNRADLVGRPGAVLPIAELLAIAPPPK